MILTSLLKLYVTVAVDRRMSMSQENKTFARSFLQDGFDDGNLSVKAESMPQSHCQHRLLSAVPIVSLRVEGGYASRCLLCGVVGPVRGSGQTAREALVKRETCHEEKF